MSPNDVVKSELPWKLVVALCLCDGAHYYAICSLFSYSGIMSADLGWVRDRDQAGFVAGFLASASMIGRTMTSSLWGLAASKHGYKKALITSFSSIAVGGLIFGLSTNFWVALAVRLLLLGAGNGWVTIMAPLALEIGGAERQADVLGMIIGCGSFTQLFGPAVSGWTYSSLPEFPAMVPSAIGSVYAFFTLITILAWVPSSLGVYSTVQATDDVEECSSSKVVPSNACSRTSILQWPIILITSMRITHGAMTMGFAELVPLWLISTTPFGGLELSQQEVGTFLARAAIWNMVYFMVIMPRGIKRFGLRCFGTLAGATAGSCCAMLPFLTMPLVANLVHALGISTSISTGAIAAMCTNNSVHQEKRAEIAGTVVIFETFAKAVGPVVIASLFAWTLSHWGRAGRVVVFFLLAVMHAIFCIGAMCLPASIESPPEEVARVVEHELDLRPDIIGSVITARDHGDVKAQEDNESLGMLECKSKATKNVDVSITQGMQAQYPDAPCEA